MNQWITEPTNQRINESTNQRINGSTDQRINGSMDQWINESMDHWINGSMDHWIYESMNQWINESMNIPAQLKQKLCPHLHFTSLASTCWTWTSIHIKSQLKPRKNILKIMNVLKYLTISKPQANYPCT